MRIPKIIFLNVNIEKEILRQRKKEMKKTLSKIQTDLSQLINSDEKSFDETLMYIRNSIQCMNEKDIKNLYKEYTYATKDCNKIDFKKECKENEVTISLIEDLNLEKIDNRNKKISTSILDILNKVDKFLNKKSVKILIGFATTLFFMSLGVALYKQNTVAIATVAPMTEIPEKINTAYTYIKTLGFVVAFVFLAVELIQSGLKGDTRAMAMIFAKYLMFSVALLSFKAIYDMIDEFFNS